MNNQPQVSQNTAPQGSRMNAWNFMPNFIQQLIAGDELDPDVQKHFFGVASKDTQLSFLPQEFIELSVDINTILTELHKVMEKITSDETTMDDASFFKATSTQWNIQQKLLIQLYRGKDGNTMKQIGTIRHESEVKQTISQEKTGGLFHRER